MTSPNRRRMRLAEMRQQASEALGVEPGLDIELENGEIVSVPSPLLAPDGAEELVGENKTVEAAKLILGAKDYARLIKHGGTSKDVILAWAVMKRDLEDRGDQKSAD
jgi:hypothetical protein